ncbi:MAG: hypothetical protein A2Z06_00530 [Candidatus Glassbacteria bacterium RBG_16_58_8]|uniref:Uncharacterized protein n=1 Tax=Candidatus Glassbacteria bacterium RBG_16_58_8 TaxID=1817866 RepID=A0A1F5YC68_9BACT|nr:MAG: hypothetical protein A2Z06_00530 [Candidatus Glassbacteria bacterium RBG_16_58_8]
MWSYLGKGAFPKDPGIAFLPPPLLLRRNESKGKKPDASLPVQIAEDAQANCGFPILTEVGETLSYFMQSVYKNAYTFSVRGTSDRSWE